MSDPQSSPIAASQRSQRVSDQPLRVTLPREARGERLDRVLAQSLSHVLDLRRALQLEMEASLESESARYTPSSVIISAKKMKRWIESGYITLISLTSESDEALSADGDSSSSATKIKASQRVQGGETFLVCLPSEEQSTLVASLIPHDVSEDNSQLGYWGQVRQRAEQADIKLGEILHLDADFIALNKPTSLPTAPTLDPQRETLYHRALKTLIQGQCSSGETSASPYLRVTHRLDRDTSGVVIMSRSRSANRSLGDAFSGHTARKRYWLICARPSRGPLAEHLYATHGLYELSRRNTLPELIDWAIDQDLSFSPHNPPLKLSAPIIESPHRPDKRARWSVYEPHNADLSKSSVVSEAKRRSRLKGIKSAETWIYPLAFTPHLILIEARPLTGRTHQIRVHLTHLHAPLLGDELYDGPYWHRLALHARHLNLPHPRTQVAISLYAPIPWGASSTSPPL